MFGGLGNLGSLMKQAMQMKERMAEVQAELERQVHEASSGGGLVTAKVNGRGELVDIQISPEAVRPDDVEMLAELIKSAVGAAAKQARESAKQALGEVTGGLNLSGLEDLLGGAK